MSGKAKESGLHEKNSLKTKVARSPVHFNGHQAVTMYATYYPKSDDIRAISVMAFNIHFNLVEEINPFVAEIQSPSKLSLDYGLMPEIFPEVLSDWLHQMKLPYGKKLIPICWDSARLTKALYQLIDYDLEDTIFRWHDLQQYVRFFNDLAWDRGEAIPYPKDHLGSVLKRALKAEVMPNDAGYTGFQMITLFKHFLKKGYKS